MVLYRHDGRIHYWVQQDISDVLSGLLSAWKLLIQIFFVDSNIFR